MWIFALSRKRLFGAALLSGLLLSSQCFAVTTFKVLYTFTGTTDGGVPSNGSLILDANGNLYGTTEHGGEYDSGTAYEVSTNGTETVLHSFAEGSGGFPPDALVMDKKGNLWGTTDGGGNQTDCGVIFEITGATEKLVHTFTGEPDDGCAAFAAMIIGGDGNFYGTSTGGGKYNRGTVFELAPDGTDKLLHFFGSGRGGYSPFAGVFMDASGNFYGADAGGGSRGFGTLFEIVPSGHEAVLHSFKGSRKDGSIPDGRLIRDQSGNFYGTVLGGGRAGCEANLGCGAVFKLTPDGKETILHFFKGGRRDGANPSDGLIADGAGNLYGTTWYGGASCTPEPAYGCGTVFKVAPDGSETILYNFSKNNGANGANPVAGLVADAAGNLYGTASFGGAYGYGTVFEITPSIAKGRFLRASTSARAYPNPTKSTAVSP
ncbi:MAG: choice-of-anchor tandem repeat GloVer-containing protein [Rhizomicrobium sp.]